MPKSATEYLQHIVAETDYLLVQSRGLDKEFRLGKLSGVCLACSNRVCFSCRGIVHVKIRGSGWAGLALGSRLALGAATSNFFYALLFPPPTHSLTS